MKKIKVGLYFSGSAFILTFIITRGKFISGSVVFWRMVGNAIVFFIIGMALEFLYNKYIAKKLEEIKNNEDFVSESPDLQVDKTKENITQAGSSLNVTVGDDDLENEITSGADEHTEVSTNETYAPPPPKKNTGSSDGKAKVDGDFIVYEDKRIPNDPKLIAQAIKTKLADE